MNFIKSNFILLFFWAALAGCGGGTVDSDEDLAEVEVKNRLAAKDIEQNFFGYWDSTQANNPKFEFFSTAFEPIPVAPQENLIKTGRIFENGVLVNYFYWNLQVNGQINLNMISPSCNVRPLNLCQVIGTASITAEGSSIYDATWKISYDNNDDGIQDKIIIDKYLHKEIGASAFSNGEFYLTRSRDFGVALHEAVRGEISNNMISVNLNFLEKPITLSTIYDSNKAPYINFGGDEKSSVINEMEFFVTDIGHRTLPVKEWYENVRLHSTVNNGFILTFEKHHKVLIPDDINPKAVQINDAELPDGISIEYPNKVEKFNNDILVRAGDIFYTYLGVNFDEDKAAGGGGNTLVFTSNTEGTLSHTDNVRGNYSESKNFTWTPQNDGSIVLDFPDYGTVTLRVIKPINGGHLVLWTKPTEWGSEYRVADLIRDSEPVLNEYNLPGRYQFGAGNTQPNGTYAFDVTFHKDKTVSGYVQGYWFQDTNGDIVSFQCTDLIGLPINNYSDCENKFENIAMVSLAHIRRIRFMHKDGNNYQSKYDGSYYGEFFGITGKYYTTVALTYRWRRVGDEPVETR